MALTPTTQLYGPGTSRGQIPGMGTRARKAAMALNARTAADLAARSSAELLGVKNCGPTTLEQIRRALAGIGLRLRDDDDGGARWEDLKAAGRRLGRNPGHLRKVCPHLEEKGLARRARGEGRSTHWELRGDVELSALAGTLPAPRPGTSVSLVVGDSIIRIRSTAAVTVTVSPAAGDGDGKRPEHPTEGAPTDNR